jgi:putative transposase
MSQYQITLNESDLLSLFDGQGLKTLAEQVINQVLSAQVSAQLQAQPHERTDERQGYRNGYRERPLTTRIGTLTLHVPKLRQGTFSPELFERWQRSETALFSVLVEMVIQGVSTRKVSAVVEELCGHEVSKSFVSDLCKSLDPQVLAWRERDLSGTVYPFVLVDALVVRVREDGAVRQCSLLIACGIRADGIREILGFHLGDKESEASWGGFYQSLKDRGLHGLDLVVSDSHSGLVAALHTHFQEAVWQRCQTHVMRNLMDSCPKAHQDGLHRAVRRLFEADTPAIARQELTLILAEFGTKASKSVSCLEAAFDDAIAVLRLPVRYRKRLRTTNSQERLNEEVRRRERVIRIFPNRASVERLLGALLIEFDEGWSTGKKYLDMTEYWEWKQARSTSSPTLNGSSSEPPQQAG